VSIRRTLWVQIGIIAALVAIANGITLFSINELTSLNQMLLRQREPALVALGQIKAFGFGLSEASLAVLSATQFNPFSQVLIEGELSEFEDRQADLFTWLERYAQVTDSSNTDPAQTENLQSSIEALHGLALQQVTDSIAGLVDASQLQSLRETFEEAEEQFEVVVNAAIEQAQQLYAADTASIEAQSSQVQVVSWLTLLAIPMAGIVFGLRLTQSIVRPIRHLARAATRIGEGDLQTRLNLQSNNEFGLLATSVNSMMDRLNQTMVSRDYFEAIFHAVPNSLIIVRPDHTIESVNRFTRNLLGYSGDAALVGTPYRKLISEPKLDEVAINDTRHVVEIHYQAYDGSLVPINLRKSVAINRHGGEDAIIYSAVDISERKRLEDERREREALTLELARSRQLEDYKRRFVAMLSHEFRTPLSIINASAYLLERHMDKLTPEARTEHFTRINDHILRLREMMDDITTVMKAEYELIPFHPEPVDIAAVSLKIIEEMKDTIGEKHKFIAVVDFPFESIIADKSLITRIVTNLLSNAVKYSPTGSEIEFSLMEQGADILIAVKDSGIGIPKADQQFVFQPYFRGANVTNITGTGLGLRIVQEAVRLHNGDITFESVHNLGTTFRVRLPRQPGEATADSATP
jgi:PAS domain S-box-containing protein